MLQDQSAWQFQGTAESQKQRYVHNWAPNIDLKLFWMTFFFFLNFLNNIIPPQ